MCVGTLLSANHCLKLISYFSSGIFIVAAKRTPFGAYGGALTGHTATDLQEIANKAAIEAANLEPKDIDSVFTGNVMQVSYYPMMSSEVFWNSDCLQCLSAFHVCVVTNTGGKIKTLWQDC